jgi:hypothetical protein
MIVFFAGQLVFSQTEARRYVVVHTEVLKESAWFFAKSLGSLSFGDSVILIRDGGKWSQVRAGNLSGWVISSSLGARRIIVTGTGASATELSLAGKGFSPELELEYSKNGLDYSIVDSMEKIIRPPEELLDFIKEGRLARGE